MKDLKKLLEKIENTKMVMELTEMTILKEGEGVVTLKVPKWTITKDWGVAGSEVREMINTWARNLEGGTLQEKLKNAEIFLRKSPMDIIYGTDGKKLLYGEVITKIISHLIFIEHFAQILNDQVGSVGGFLMEAFMAGLSGQESEVIDIGGMNVIDFVEKTDTGDVKYSLKTIQRTSAITGSRDNIVRDLLRYGQPLKYMTILKEEAPGEEEYFEAKIFVFNVGIRERQTLIKFIDDLQKYKRSKGQYTTKAPKERRKYYKKVEDDAVDVLTKAAENSFWQELVNQPQQAFEEMFGLQNFTIYGEELTAEDLAFPAGDKVTSSTGHVWGQYGDLLNNQTSLKKRFDKSPGEWRQEGAIENFKVEKNERGLWTLYYGQKEIADQSALQSFYVNPKLRLYKASTAYKEALDAQIEGEFKRFQQETAEANVDLAKLAPIMNKDLTYTKGGVSVTGTANIHIDIEELSGKDGISVITLIGTSKTPGMTGKTKKKKKGDPAKYVPSRLVPGEDNGWGGTMVASFRTLQKVDLAKKAQEFADALTEVYQSKVVQIYNEISVLTDNINGYFLNPVRSEAMTRLNDAEGNVSALQGHIEGERGMEPHLTPMQESKRAPLDITESELKQIIKEETVAEIFGSRWRAKKQKSGATPEEIIDGIKVKDLKPSRHGKGVDLHLHYLPTDREFKFKASESWNGFPQLQQGALQILKPWEGMSNYNKALIAVIIASEIIQALVGTGEVDEYEKVDYQDKLFDIIIQLPDSHPLGQAIRSME